MSQRTTISAVVAVLSTGGDYDNVNSPSVQPFVDTASVIVDRVRTMAASKGMSLTDAELELIERWLSAHAYAMVDQPYTSRSTGGASGSFQGQTGLGLSGTKYGQTAMALDWSGSLTVIDKRQFARAVWLGKPPADQLPLDQRGY